MPFVKSCELTMFKAVPVPRQYRCVAPYANPLRRFVYHRHHRHHRHHRLCSPVSGAMLCLNPMRQPRKMDLRDAPGDAPSAGAARARNAGSAGKGRAVL